MRRLNGTKKLKSRQISIDNDNLDDDPLIYDNAQDADNRSISHLGASLRTKKRRDRAQTVNEAISGLRKTSSEVSDMVLYQQSILAKDQSQHLSNSGESDDHKPESIFKQVKIEYSVSEDDAI